MEQLQLWYNKNEINFKYFENKISDSKTSEETVYTFEPLNPKTNNLCSDTEVILDYSTGFAEIIKIYLVLFLSMEQIQNC